jgi:hypothetical protein
VEIGPDNPGDKPVHNGVDVCPRSVNVREIIIFGRKDKREIGPSEKYGIQLFSLDHGIGKGTQSCIIFGQTKRWHSGQ